MSATMREEQTSRGERRLAALAVVLAVTAALLSLVPGARGQTVDAAERDGSAAMVRVDGN